MNSQPNLIRSPGTALHRQIFLVLRDAIVQGIYPAGTALPKEESLAEQFGVSRVTVRRALADLESQGLVQRRHGRGTFVLGDPSSVASLATLGFVGELQRTAQMTEVTVLTLEKSTPPPWVSLILQTPREQTAIHAVRMRSVGDTPLMVTEAWVPESVGRRITVAALKKRALYEILMANGVEFGRVVQQISADAADPAKATVLKCEVGSPLIRLTRLVHDRKGQPVQHMTAHITPQHSRILMDIPGAAIDTLSGGHIMHNPELLRHADNGMRNPRNRR